MFKIWKVIEMVRKYPRRSKRKMSYHGRTGHPVLHKDEESGKVYIMVRKSGGGNKRLYLVKGRIPKKHRG